jgi:hypothetical protein
MLDDVDIVPLPVAVACLASADVKSYGLADLPAKHSLATICDGVLEMASASSLMQHLSPDMHGIDRSHFVGALIMYTMEKPYPFYKLINVPLNVQGVRSTDSLSAQLKFLKLITLALRAVPKTSDFWFRGPVYRGVSIESSVLLMTKFENYETAFAPKTKITFAAPTSATLSAKKASEFTNGIQYVIQGEHGAGPGGVYLKPGDISAFDEEEVLLEAPLVCEVVAATKPENTVIVVLRVISSKMTYLSKMPSEAVRICAVTSPSQKKSKATLHRN